MPISTKVNDLKINKLTKAQYDAAVEAGVIGENELSIITDIEAGQVIQVDELPEATSENEGKIYQYIGETIPEVEASATITQTVGSGLTDLTVDVKSIETLGLEDGEIVNFFYTNRVLTKTYGTSGGVTATINDSTVFFTKLSEFEQQFNIVADRISVLCAYHNDTIPARYEGEIRVYDANDQQYVDYGYANWGVTFEAEPGATENTWLFCIEDSDILYTWVCNKSTDEYAIPSSFGISYTGIPQQGDELEVTYSTYKPSIINGYFYQNQSEYSDPIATIAQTVGNHLTNLAIDVNKFVKTEQPVGDETVDFVNVVIDANISHDDINDWEITLDSQGIIDYVDSQGGSQFIDNFREGTIYCNGNNWYTTLRDNYNNNWEYEISTYVTVIQQGYDRNVGTITGISRSKNIWTKDSIEVNISDYGISYTGTPEDNDKLTVTYTHPSVIGYQWNQKNVQPSSGGESIDWVTITDVHEGESHGWSTYPIYTVEGGLPNGEYEFYWQVKTGTGNSYFPFGLVTYKALVKIDNDNHTVYGYGTYVIDGQWMPDSGNFTVGDYQLYNLFYGYGNDLLLFNGNRPWATDIYGYVSSGTEVLECFKLSSIRNTKTGEKYIAEGRLYDGNSIPYDYYYGGQISFRKLQQDPYVPTYHTNTSLYLDGYYQYAKIQPNYAISTKNNTANCCELDISLVSETGGRWHCIIENTYDSYTARLLEASGDLENVQIGLQDNLYTYLYFNSSIGLYKYIYASVGVKGSSDGVSIWMNNASNFTPITLTRIGSEVTENNFGTIEQYTGTTDSNYINGYFYKATGDKTVTPAEIDVYPYDSGITITINNEDVNTFVNYIRDYHGWSVSYVEQLLANRNYEWQLFYDVNSGQVTQVYWSATGVWYYDSTFCDCFHVNGATQNNYWLFNLQYTPEHIEIQNGHWEQIDVQNSFPDQTSQSGKFLTTDGTNVSWATVDALPTQSGQSGKFLTTNGTTASWASVITTPSTDPVLDANNWVTDQQTGDITQSITVQGVATNNAIFVSPGPLSIEDFVDAGIVCISQGTNQLTFKCDVIPTNDITLSIVILG